MRKCLMPVVVAVLAAGCSAAGDPGDVGLLPAITPGEAQQLLAGSTEPVVLNVWASWCIPCRSEAPLLREAQASFGGEIRFIGISVRDSQHSARSFLNEFGLDSFEQFFDPDGLVPGTLGGRGVPHTFFFAPGGELVELRFGVIDERTLALNLDELMRRGS